jgi:DegV family protein with EDD domain
LEGKVAIKLLTDSCCDLTNEYLKERDIDYIPLMYTIEGNDYYDDFNISMSSKEFYGKVRNGSMSKTSLVNSQRYDDFFGKYLDAGDDIVYIGFSSVLSGSYQSSVISAGELKEKYPDRKITVIDSKCASMGEGLIVHYAAEKLASGAGYDELVSYIEETKGKVCHWFTVDDLHHLKRGGRVSSVSATVGTLLSIKPVLHVDDEGALIPMSKSRGRSASLNALVKEMEKTVFDEGEGQTVMISHGDCIEDAQKVEEIIKKKFPKVKEIVINVIGPVIGSHAGPGTVALFFLGSSR